MNCSNNTKIIRGLQSTLRLRLDPNRRILAGTLHCRVNRKNKIPLLHCFPEIPQAEKTAKMRRPRRTIMRNYEDSRGPFDPS